MIKDYETGPNKPFFSDFFRHIASAWACMEFTKNNHFILPNACITGDRLFKLGGERSQALLLQHRKDKLRTINPSNPGPRLQSGA